MLKALLAGAVLSAAACGQPIVDQKTGGATGENAGVDAVDPTTPTPPSAAAAPAVTPTPPGAAAGTDGVTEGSDGAAAGRSGTETPGGGAVDSTDRPRGIEGVGGENPGEAGVDASAPPVD